MRLCTVILLLSALVVLTACGGVTRSAPVTQSQSSQGGTPTLTSISVTPNGTSLTVGATQQLNATGTYSDNSTKDLTSSVTWGASPSGLVSISSSGMLTAQAAGTVTVTATSGSISGSASLTITPPPAPTLSSIAVTPNGASVAVGGTQQMTATGTFSDNSQQDLTSSVTWSASPSGMVSISSSGVLTALAAGSVTVTATSGSASGSAQLTVTAPVLSSIVVSPASGSIAAGQTLQFSASGVWSDNSTRDVTADPNVVWTSSDTTKATVAGGLATGVAQGSATISATWGSISGSASLTVNAATLTSLSLWPDSAVIAKGADQQFSATGLYSDSTTQDLTASAAWQSDNTAVADMGQPPVPGLFLGLTPGTANITASMTGATPDTSVLTVINAQLSQIIVNPSNPTVSTITPLQFAATGVFTDGSESDITPQVAWSVGPEGVASISNSGLATPLKAGSTAVTATLGSLSGSTTLTVNGATLTGIVVTPVNQKVGVGATVQYAATGVFADGSTQDITSAVTWTSSNANIAMISASALASTTGMGTATITASFGPVSGSASLTVTAATLQQILILPASFDVTTLTIPPTQPGLSMTYHTRLQLKAVGYYSDQTFRTLLGVAWNSNKPSIAVLTGPGVVRSKWKTGTVTVKVSWNGFTGSAPLAVTNATVSSLTISPSPAQMAAGTKQQFLAMATMSDGTTQDVTYSTRWTTSDYTVAIVNSGIVTAVSAGSAQVTATYYNQSGTATTGSSPLTVTNAKLTGITVSGASSSSCAGSSSCTIPLGASLQFAAVGSFDDLTMQDLTLQAAWSSSAPTVAIMSSSTPGLAVSSGAGNTTVGANVGASGGTASLTVTPPAQ